MNVRCGNTEAHGWPTEDHHHASVAEVRQCFATTGGLRSVEEVEGAEEVMADEEWAQAQGWLLEASLEEAPAAPVARTTTTTASGMAEPGYYVAADGDFVCVVNNRSKTATYAKRLVIVDNGARKTASWEYAPGVGRTLATLEPMTLEAAAAFGHLHGFCIKCCRPLTDPKSVQAGIGPVCAKAFR